MALVFAANIGFVFWICVTWQQAYENDFAGDNFLYHYSDFHDFIYKEF